MQKLIANWWTHADVLTAVFTGGIFIVGIMQLGLFWYQLRIMRKSLIDAEEAAKTAKEAANATAKLASTIENNGKQQMRAYISVELLGEVPQARTTGWKYEVRMIIRNTGFTPAHAVNFEMRAALMDSILPDNFNLSLPVSKHEEKGHIPYTGQKTIRACISELITPEEITEMKTGTNLCLYVWGTIWYKDVFGEEHHTNFCQIGTWDVKGIFGTVNISRHNDAN